MYPLDFVESFTGLSSHQIKRLESEGVIIPQKKSGMKYYSFTDIYVLRTIQILLREGIKPRKIRFAYECLQSLKPDRPLSSFILFHNGREILDFTDDPKIIASRYGQIVQQTLIEPSIKTVSIGTELDRTRRRVLEYKDSLERRSEDVKKSRKTYGIDELAKLLA